MMDPRESLTQAYRDFNARRMDDVLARMSQDVVWANGWEGGYVRGHEGVRDYWTRQWAVLDPQVEPMAIQRDEAGRWVVEVHVVVRDGSGQVVADAIVHHAYSIRGGLIERMDIE
jgi:hypothetical protein